MHPIKPNPSDMPSRWPHRVAVLLALVVFPLIWVGGLVTTYDAGMAVPDWPGTYGYNMFLYPIETWLTGPFDLLVEHGHRLLGSAAGIIAIGLVVVTWIYEPRISVRWFAVGLLVLVILQGVLGGIRVRADERIIAKIHGCVGPAFFAAVVAFCVVTSRWWARAVELETSQNPAKAGEIRLTWMAGLMLVVSYGQLVIGAFLRHVGVMASPDYYRHLVIAHVVTAVLIVVGTLIQWFFSRAEFTRKTGVRWPINVLVMLVGLQFGLGIGTWVVKFGWPVWFENHEFAAGFIIGEKSYWQMHLVTAHVATGSLILAVWTIHFLRCYRIFGIRGDSTSVVDASTHPNSSSIH